MKFLPFCLSLLYFNAILPLAHAEDIPPQTLEQSAQAMMIEAKPNPPSLAKPAPLLTQNIDGINVTLPNTMFTNIQLANLSPKNISMIVQPLSQEATKPLINHLANTARIPASTQKLIPTWIALDTLGKDFLWFTRVYQQGMVINGTLYGNLLIKGSGDPKLNNEKLNLLLSVLIHKGIRHIQGDIIIDNDIFQQVNFNPFAFDGQGLRAYNAPPNGMLINFGTIQVDYLPSGKTSLIKVANQIEPVEHFIPDLKASKVAIKVSPTLADYDATTTLPTSSEPCGKASPVKTKLTSQSLQLTGEVSVHCGRYSQWLTFPDSDTLVKKAIKGTWQQFDPKFNGNVYLAKENTGNLSFWQKISHPLPMFSLPSYPLANQIWDINQFSNNVMTEQVTLSLPIYANHAKVSDYPTAFSFIQQWWKQNLPNTTPPIMTRGSGLCRDCFVEPASLLALLNYAYHTDNFEVFRQSMAIAGQSGTMKSLKKRNPLSPAIGRAWIKTGTLDEVTSMAGYVQSQSGKWYAVVGMINAPRVSSNVYAKAILDDMLAWTALQP